MLLVEQSSVSKAFDEERQADSSTDHRSATFSKSILIRRTSFIFYQMLKMHAYNYNPHP